MDIKELLIKIPYVYHLTSAENLPVIANDRTLQSTTSLVNNSTLTSEGKSKLLHSRRESHTVIEVNKTPVHIRDQQPISIKSLKKCLQDNLTYGEFIKLLNDRVFFWPSIKRLAIHFNRYENEKPIIFKISLSDLIDNNDNVLLCHLNSGATRCHPKWGGAPPPRGLNTFKSIDEYDEGLTRLAEVTILDSCIIPTSSAVGHHPNGPWETF